MSDSICVYDFAGNSRDPGMWADFYPKRKVVVFGGYWSPVPDMPAEDQPSEDQVSAHASKYETTCRERYEAYLAGKE